MMPLHTHASPLPPAAAAAKSCIALLALGLAAYLLAPPLYWHFVHRFAASCPPCICDCPSEAASIPSPDCIRSDPWIRQELEKNSVELLTEELKLQGVAADEIQQRADSALLEAKKVSSQYQKEAEKCNIGMETCEAAREKADEALIAQKKITTMWERRARDLGWKTG